LNELDSSLTAVNAKTIIHPLPTIPAYASQMHFLCKHLLENCLTFAHTERPLAIEVNARSIRIESDSYYEITVKDNGIGFDNKYRERIFGVFQRLHGRTDFNGNGMGLAICHKIGERHNGSISASSSPEMGAKFTITLPASTHWE
jgi:light-regulated signal transduction histidine kinase (bacteriophytochrome)